MKHLISTALLYLVTHWESTISAGNYTSFGTTTSYTSSFQQPLYETLDFEKIFNIESRKNNPQLLSIVNNNQTYVTKAVNKIQFAYKILQNNPNFQKILKKHFHNDMDLLTAHLLTIMIQECSLNSQDWKLTQEPKSYFQLHPCSNIEAYKIKRAILWQNNLDVLWVVKFMDDTDLVSNSIKHWKYTPVLQAFDEQDIKEAVRLYYTKWSMLFDAMSQLSIAYPNTTFTREDIINYIIEKAWWDEQIKDGRPRFKNMISIPYINTNDIDVEHLPYVWAVNYIHSAPAILAHLLRTQYSTRQYPRINQFPTIINQQAYNPSPELEVQSATIWEVSKEVKVSWGLIGVLKSAIKDPIFSEYDLPEAIATSVWPAIQSDLLKKMNRSKLPGNLSLIITMVSRNKMTISTMQYQWATQKEIYKHTVEITD